MATFADRNKKDWIIELDGPLIEKVQKATNIDIAAEDGTGLLKACARGDLIVRVCWLLCEEQAALDQVTAKSFGKAMASGEVIEGAEKALRQALTDFTRPSRRDALTRVLRSQDQVTETTLAAVIEKVEDPATRTALVEASKARMTTMIEELVKKINPQTKASPSSASDLPDTAIAAPVASP